MKKKFTPHKILLTLALLTSLEANAASNTSLITFTANTAAKAAEVNSNFTYLDNKINTLQSQMNSQSTSAPTAINTIEYIPTFSGSISTTESAPVTLIYDRYEITGSSTDSATINGTTYTGMKSIGTRTTTVTRKLITVNTSNDYAEIKQTIEEKDTSGTLTFKKVQYFHREMSTKDLFLNRQDKYNSSGSSVTATQDFHNLLIRPNGVTKGATWTDSQLLTITTDSDRVATYKTTGRAISSIDSKPTFVSSSLNLSSCFKERDFDNQKTRIFCKGAGLTERFGNDKSTGNFGVLVLNSVQ